MKRRIIIGSLIVVTIFGFGWFILATQPKEPVYKGKPLSVYLKSYRLLTKQRFAANRIPVELVEAHDAVVTVGTNGIPIYLRMLQSRDSSLKLKLITAANYLPFIRTDFVTSSDKRFVAGKAFAILGVQVSNTVPALLNIYEHDTDSASQCAVADALACIGHAARPAVPALVRGATNSNLPLAIHSAHALSWIAEESDMPIIIPLLTQMLTNSSSGIRSAAVDALTQLGPLAKPAIPALINYLKYPVESPDQQLSQSVAAAAIQIIDPAGAAARKSEIDAALRTGKHP